jgi:hypothetical protein
MSLSQEPWVTVLTPIYNGDDLKFTLCCSGTVSPHEGLSLRYAFGFTLDTSLCATAKPVKC